MPITDNRTLLDAANALTNWVEEDGATMNLALNTARIQGTNAVVKQVSAERAGIFYDAGSNQDWSDNVFYLWWNLTTSNLLATIANLGVTVRFASGATPSTNYFEVAVAGSDTYSGGWQMAVIDIEEARARAVASPQVNAATGGTTPETSAIQFVGIMYDVTGMIPGTDPNAFVDAIWRLPVGTPGIIVSGENDAGSPIIPWTWDDIVDAGDIADVNKAWGTITKNDGVIKVNTPIQFGADGSPAIDHDFEDTNVVAAWESQLVRDGFYGLTIKADPTGTQRFVMGVNGSAGQGLTMLAASDGPRWDMQATDPDLDEVGLYGCSFTHTGIIDLVNATVDIYDSLLIDGRRLIHSERIEGVTTSCDYRRNSVIQPVPDEDGIIPDYPWPDYVENPLPSPSTVAPAYMYCANPAAVIGSTFSQGPFGGHAMHITAGGTYDLSGNTFTDYAAGDDDPNSAVLFDGVHESFFDEDSAFGQPRNNSGGFLNDTSQVEMAYKVPVEPGEIIQQARFVVARSTSGLTSPENKYKCTVIGSTPGGSPFPHPDDSDTYNTATETVQPTDAPAPGSPIIAAYKVFNFPLTSPLDAPAGPAGSPLENVFYLRFERVVAGPISGAVPIFTGRVDESPLEAERYWNKSSTVSPEDWFVSGSSPWYTVKMIDPTLVLNVSGGASPSISSELDVTVNNNVNVTITNIQPGTEVRVYPAQDFNSPADLTEIGGVESTGSPSEFSFSASAGQIVDIVVLNQNYVLPPANRIRNFIVPTSDSSFPISQIVDRNYRNP